MEKEDLVSVIFRIMSVVSLCATMVVGCRNFFVEKDIKEIQTAQGQIQFEREFKFKIYELVLTAIKSESEKEQMSSSTQARQPFFKATPA